MIISAKVCVLNDILCLESSASNTQKFILETRVVLAQWKKKAHSDKIVSRSANGIIF